MQPPKPKTPQKPASLPPKGPYEKRGGIPREEFSEFLKKGSYSMPWSRKRGGEQLKRLGEKMLKERFPGYYGRDISGSEIQREIDELKTDKNRLKTKVEQDALQEQIVRLEEAKKRAGL